MKRLMGVTLGLAFSACATAAQPNQYEVEAQFFLGGVPVSSPRIVVREGEPSEIAQTSQNPYSKVRMRVVTNELSSDRTHDDILLKMEIEYTRDGKSVKSSPQFLTKVGSRASISLASNGEDFRVDVRAVRK